MYQAYYPVSNAMALIWLNNYKTQIGVQGPLLGLTAAQIATQVTAVQKLLDSINDIETKKQAFASSVAAFKSAEANFLAPLKVEIARYKTNLNYTQAIGQILGVVGSSSVVDAATYKCKFTVEHFGGFVRIQFVKAGVEGVNIYHRQKGQLQWKFLARDTKSPYHDHIVLQTPGQPEHWEYQLFGVINDVEIGLASDIVEVVFGA